MRKKMKTVIMHYVLMMIACAYILAIFTACSSTYETRELPDPNTGDIVQATVKKRKALGFIPCGSDIIYPHSNKTSGQLFGETKESLVSWGTLALFVGGLIAVLGIGISLAYTSGVAHTISGVLLLVGLSGVGGGLISIGIALALVWALIGIVLCGAGFVLYLLRNKPVFKGLLKWRSSGLE